ncbi:phage major capsid protein [Georgenia sp. AZ-5]|uniref:phage major capsid protein n=1 Tax=Georgenia sp. AZ-5 TaxID=3367526 RepID=UPI003754DEB6
MTTTSGVALLTPAQVEDVFVRPLTQQAVCARVSRVVRTQSHDLRVPIVTSDVGASWVAEGAEIPLGDMTLTDLVITPTKMARVVGVTREAANDTSPAAVTEVAQSLVRSFQVVLDSSFFGGAGVAPAPNGLGALAGVNTVATAAGGWANLDVFTDAIVNGQTKGHPVTAFVANSADVTALSKLRDETGSNRPLLGPDPTVPGSRQILGVPLLTSDAVPASTVWAIPQTASLLVIREGAAEGPVLETDKSVWFTKDQVAVKGILRISWGWPYPAAITKITKTA